MPATPDCAPTDGLPTDGGGRTDGQTARRQPGHCIGGEGRGMGIQGPGRNAALKHEENMLILLVSRDLFDILNHMQYFDQTYGRFCVISKFATLL